MWTSKEHAKAKGIIKAPVKHKGIEVKYISPRGLLSTRSTSITKGG